MKYDASMFQFTPSHKGRPYRALKRCFEFVTENNFTPQTINKLKLRLNSFPGVIKDFIEEME